jgi:tRNA(Ile)-lysidine synthase
VQNQTPTAADAVNNSLQNRVLEFVVQRRMLVAGDTAGVAVSGGADSAALLRLLSELRGELGVRIVVLHFNHQLRGAEADADEQFAASLAAGLGFSCVTAREDVAAAAHVNGWNLEDAGRRLRYSFFNSVVDSGRATKVCVAHTADDQAETVLAHILRGTGPAGLAGIHPIAGHVVRPLLGVRRAELREYLSALGQTWREDASNEDTTRLRARLRHQLLPQLEREFQPEIVARLGQLASLARDDAAFWDALVTDRVRAYRKKESGGVSIRVSDLDRPLPPDSARIPGVPESLKALSSRIVRRLAAEAMGETVQLSALHVEQVLHLAAAGEIGSRIELPGGLRVSKYLDQLIFCPPKRVYGQNGGVETDSRAQTYEYSVDLLGGESAAVSVPEIGRCIRLKVIDWPGTRSDTRSEAEALDWALLRPPLVLRNWRPGDSYRPRGRRHIHKLSRLLQASRIAAGERVSWPVLTSAGALVWVRGLPVAAEFAARAETKTGLVVAEEAL